MKKLTLGSIILCMLSAASLAADPTPNETSATNGGASKGADASGWGTGTGPSALTVTAIVVVTGAVIAALVSSSSDSTTTATSHAP